MDHPKLATYILKTYHHLKFSNTEEIFRNILKYLKMIFHLIFIDSEGTESLRNLSNVENGAKINFT